MLVGNGVSVGTGVEVAAANPPPEQAKIKIDVTMIKLIFVTTGFGLNTVFISLPPQESKYFYQCSKAVFTSQQSLQNWKVFATAHNDSRFKLSRL